MDFLVHARFWSKVDVRPNLCRCWEWKASRNSLGYGQFKLDGASDLAHRIAVRLSGVPLHSEQVVMHTCDNPACCNPRHLLVADHAQNVADRVAKGRSARGSKNGRAKLTDEQVLLIRADNRPLSQIAADYGVTVRAITHIQMRRTWKHV